MVVLLVLRNAVAEKDVAVSSVLNSVWYGNKTLCVIYTLKEQLQTIWDESCYETMVVALEAWCRLEKSTRILIRSSKTGHHIKRHFVVQS
ncbi:transposase IS204/IS1001/IS1096/IS1165 family protein [Vibrio sp. EJY3]|nr:transposase IS204/IS1001/IS1096/IS1165 family protein [Vibrio sp. EJY3]